MTIAFPIRSLSLPLTLAALAAPAAASAQAQVSLQISLPVLAPVVVEHVRPEPPPVVVVEHLRAEPPPLVLVEPDLRVVPNFHEEVFFVGDCYWLRRGDSWYRARDHRARFTRVDHRWVPHTLARVPPGYYRHWRGEQHWKHERAYRRWDHDRGHRRWDHDRDRRHARDDRREWREARLGRAGGHRHEDRRGHR
jgi:hypothetical protein